MANTRREKRARPVEPEKMSEKLTTIAFDADDTLWHNESFFQLTQARFADLLSNYAETDHLMERLLAAERRNLGRYGFGIKGFVLSMIETAIEVTEQKVPATIIAELIAAGQEMLTHPIHLLEGARETIEALTTDHTILLITKGDLLDQERKLAQSGLGDLFDGVEIVSDKQPTIYQRIFDTHGAGPQAAMMVGNSLKSDIHPALEVGSWAVHIPYDVTWELEHADRPTEQERFREIRTLHTLPDVVRQIAS
jgi:putative hydrolase of the HAD superfamily